MNRRTIAYGTRLVALGAVLGACIALAVTRRWGAEEQARREHEVEILTKTAELARLDLELQRLREENRTLTRASTKGGDGGDDGVDGGVRAPFEFIDFSKPGKPTRQLCDCDSSHRCRCY